MTHNFPNAWHAFPMTSCLCNLQQRSLNGQDDTRKLTKSRMGDQRGTFKSDATPVTYTHIWFLTAFPNSTSHMHPLHIPLVSESPWSVTCTPLAVSSNSYNALGPRPNNYARANIGFYKSARIMFEHPLLRESFLYSDANMLTRTREIQDETPESLKTDFQIHIQKKLLDKSTHQKQPFEIVSCRINKYTVFV